VKTRVALLGAWHVHAKDHVASLLARPEQVEVAGIWDEDPEVARAFAETFGIPVLADVDAVLIDDTIAGVVVGTKTSQHVEILTRAARAGKHLFAEKVIAARSEEAEEIVASARANGVTVTIALQRLTEAFSVTLQALVAEGAVGQVTGVRTRFSHGGAFATWLPEAFFDPAQAQGGVLIDLAAHSLYLGMVLAGGTPLSVVAALGSVTERPSEDNAVVVSSYGSGALVVAESSFVAGFSSFQVEVVGTRGTLTVDSSDTLVRLRTSEETGWVEQQTLPRGVEPIDQFLESIRTGVQDAETLRVAVALTTLVEAAYDSASTGRSVNFSDHGSDEIFPLSPLNTGAPTA
jgi:predicted dehydrogenase